MKNGWFFIRFNALNKNGHDSLNSFNAFLFVDFEDVESLLRQPNTFYSLSAKINNAFHTALARYLQQYPSGPNEWFATEILSISRL